MVQAYESFPVKSVQNWGVFCTGYSNNRTGSYLWQRSPRNSSRSGAVPARISGKTTVLLSSLWFGGRDKDVQCGGQDYLVTCNVLGPYQIGIVTLLCTTYTSLTKADSSDWTLPDGSPSWYVCTSPMVKACCATTSSVGRRLAR